MRYRMKFQIVLHWMFNFWPKTNVTNSQIIISAFDTDPYNNPRFCLYSFQNYKFYRIIINTVGLMCEASPKRTTLMQLKKKCLCKSGYKKLRFFWKISNIILSFREIQENYHDIITLCYNMSLQSIHWHWVENWDLEICSDPSVKT